MTRYLTRFMLILTIGLATSVHSSANATISGLTFEKDILPTLKTKCIACHGASLPAAGLDLRTIGDALQGGRSGASLVPGNLAKSPIYQLSAAGKMPPSGPKLTKSELQNMASWIQSGAKAMGPKTGHWAFAGPVPPLVPDGKSSPKKERPIDAFLLRDLHSKGLTFSPRADSRTLIRRLTFDLIGLPPSPEHVEQFVNNPLPNAYEQLVDRLLADPRYGERWARHWLDLAGYADSEGILQEDLIRSNAWRYRDYVIRSFNSDKPWDQFIREQIAGDELSEFRTATKWTPEIEEQIVATGFLRTAVDATRADFNAHQFAEYQVRMLHDTQTIICSSILAVQMQCARCHDHKYEPFTQRDYYQIQACLRPAIRPEGPLLPSAARQIVAGTEADQKIARETNNKVDLALKALSDREKALNKKAADYKAQLAEIQRLRAEEEKKRISLPTIRALYDQDTKPPPTHILIRGDWGKDGAEVKPAVPHSLIAASSDFPIDAAARPWTTGRRTALANWLASERNPLTARAIVNRVWAYHFGAGIVPTTDNLGRSGANPTNQDLLDNLACAFVSGNYGDSRLAPKWSIKSLHRQILLSDAYRQSSLSRSHAAKEDPVNKLLWRQRPRRLEAEAIRDSMLQIAGNLDPAMFGEPVAEETRGTGEIAPVGEAKSGRRSIYLLVRRSMPVTFLNSFDAPVMETNCTRRLISTTPVQSLALMNSAFVSSQARTFANGIVAGQPSPANAIVDAFKKCYGRPPSNAQLTSSLAFLKQQRQRYTETKKTPTEAEALAFADLCQAILTSNEFLYVD